MTKTQTINTNTCVLCGDTFTGHGHNPEPVKDSGRCCDNCNRTVVVPTRHDETIARTFLTKLNTEMSRQTRMRFGIEVGNEYLFKNYADEPVVAQVLDTTPDDYGCIKVQVLRWSDADRQSCDRLPVEECWCYPSDLTPVTVNQ